MMRVGTHIGKCQYGNHDAKDYLVPIGHRTVVVDYERRDNHPDTYQAIQPARPAGPRQRVTYDGQDSHGDTEPELVPSCLA